MELSKCFTSLLTRQTLLIAIAAVLLLVLQILVLGAMGRSAFCTCGIGVWTWQAWSSKTSQLFADPYSASHILHGIIFFWALLFLTKKLPLRQRFLIALTIEICWELFENSSFTIDRYRTATASLNYYGDSILNSVGDTVFMIFGFWLASKLPWKVTLGIVIALELIMLVTIRDNLTLNVLMLVYPIKWIQNWQAAHG